MEIFSQKLLAAGTLRTEARHAIALATDGLASVTSMSRINVPNLVPKPMVLETSKRVALIRMVVLANQADALARAAVAKRTALIAKRTDVAGKRTGAAAKRTDAAAKRTDAVAKQTGVAARQTRADARQTDAAAKQTDVVVKRMVSVARRTAITTIKAVGTTSIKATTIKAVGTTSPDGIPKCTTARVCDGTSHDFQDGRSSNGRIGSGRIAALIGAETSVSKPMSSWSG